MKTDACLRTEELLNGTLPLPKLPDVEITTEFERPITTERDYIVGFVDLVARVCYPELYVTNLRYRDRTGEVWATNGTPELAFAKKRGSIYFEAKPAIPSLGELLRQIRTYQQYVTYSFGSELLPRFVVVSPDTRFRQMIEDQGIEFWQSPAQNEQSG